MSPIKFFVTLIILLLTPLGFAAQGDGSVSWTPPTEHVNGDPLNAATDLELYTIHVGTTSGNYGIATINVTPGGVSENVSVQLPDTYQDGDTIQLYLAMTATMRNEPGVNPAYDGSISAFSNEVLKTFLVSLVVSPPMPPGQVEAIFIILCNSAVNGVDCTITATN